MKKVESKEHFDADFRYRDKPVIIDFFATWCAPCQSINYLILDRINDHEELSFAKVDVDNESNAELLREFNVRSVPTIVRLENGKETDRIVGVPKADRINDFLSGGSDE